MSQATIRVTSVSTFRKNLESILDDVVDKNRTLIVTRPQDQNVVVISEDEFNLMNKEVNNLKYLLKIQRSDTQIKDGSYHITNFDAL